MQVKVYLCDEIGQKGPSASNEEHKKVLVFGLLGKYIECHLQITPTLCVMFKTPQTLPDVWLRLSKPASVSLVALLHVLCANGVSL